MTGITIEDILAQVPELQGRQVTAGPLAGGITNANYRVQVDGRSFFVRLPGEASALLGIDRLTEVHNSREAARLGLAPKVVAFLPESGVIVTEFLELQTVQAEVLRTPKWIERVSEAIRKLHREASFRGDFDMPARIAEYRRTIEAQGLRRPEGYGAGLEPLAELDRRLRRGAPPQAACHNDLVPENILDGGSRPFFVDYDYSGNNDPLFELGDLSVEAEFTEEDTRRLVSVYLGRTDEGLAARALLHGVFSDIGWALWASIQERSSSLAFDFAGYGRRRWERAQGKIRNGDMERWLREI